MAKVTHEFKYDLFQKVYIPELAIHGYVTGLIVGEQRKKYLISYIYDGCKKEVWFYDFELRTKK